MKLFAISDLHLSVNNPKPMNIFGPVWDNYLDEISEDWKRRVSDDDVVMIAGDISWAMHLENAEPDLDYIASLRGKKIIIRGNHDYWWKSISSVRSMLKDGMFALQNDSVKIENVVFCGSRGWTAPEGENRSAEDKKIYDRELIRMRLSLEDAKKKRMDGDRLIVMIHYPPFNTKKEPSPFTELFKEFAVDGVVYGHLHGGIRKDRNKTLDGIEYYLTSCDTVGNRLVEIK